MEMKVLIERVDRLQSSILDLLEHIIHESNWCDEVTTLMVDDALDSIASIHKDFYGFDDDEIEEAVSDLRVLEMHMIRDHYFDPEENLNYCKRELRRIVDNLESYIELLELKGE